MSSFRTRLALAARDRVAILNTARGARVLRSLLLGLPFLAASFAVMPVPSANAATSPTLIALTNYSVLGGAGVTCTGATTTTGAVGVSPNNSITGFPSPCSAGGGTHPNDVSGG